MSDFVQWIAQCLISGKIEEDVALYGTAWMRFTPTTVERIAPDRIQVWVDGFSSPVSEAERVWVVTEDFGSPRDSEFRAVLSGSDRAVRNHLIDFARATANGEPEYERIPSFREAEEGEMFISVNGRMFSARRFPLRRIQ